MNALVSAFQGVLCFPYRFGECAGVRISEDSGIATDRELLGFFKLFKCRLVLFVLLDSESNPQACRVKEGLESDTGTRSQDTGEQWKDRTVEVQKTF